MNAAETRDAHVVKPGARIPVTGPSRRVFIFVNGINAFPGDAEGWTDRAVTWTHIKTDACAEKFEYLAGTLTRRIKQQSRAEKFARMIGYYARAGGWQINLVGHSNGCDIILRTLRILRQYVELWPFVRPATAIPLGFEIASVHLIAAACESDFDRNGLNTFLAERFVRAVRVYVGRRDTAMQIAKLSKVLPFGLGYGDLGRTGPIEPRYYWTGDCIVTHVEPEYGHSDWFERGGRFDRTMEMITT